MLLQISSESQNKKDKLRVTQTKACKGFQRPAPIVMKYWKHFRYSLHLAMQISNSLLYRVFIYMKYVYSKSGSWAFLMMSIKNSGSWLLLKQRKCGCGPCNTSRVATQLAISSGISQILSGRNYLETQSKAFSQYFNVNCYREQLMLS